VALNDRSPVTREVRLAEAADTLALGAALGRGVVPPLVCWLRGELGAGKTTLVRGLLRGLGFTGKVKSPTYGLVEHYQTACGAVIHMDLYRLGHPEEVEYLALRELCTQRTTVMIEWPERASGMLPGADLELDLAISGTGRRALCRAISTAGAAWLARLDSA